MFIDARGIQTGSELTADLCIVGGGAAGITLARELEHSGISIIMLEAGGHYYEDDTQQVYDGPVDSNVLREDYLTYSRLRYFGGTTNHWGGHSVVINPNIFRDRPGVPGLAWPITADELRPYYKRAADLLGALQTVPDHRNIQAQSGLVPIERFPVDLDQMRMGPFNFDRFNRNATRILLDASVTAINPEWNDQKIRDLTVKTLAGNSFTVAARAFVLATGAIENARLLMLPTEINQSGIGNGHGLVGRNFADHLYGRGLFIETASQWNPDDEAFFTLSPELQDEIAAPELGVLRKKGVQPFDPGDAVISALTGLLDETATPRKGRITYSLEALPIPENRVMLSSKRDPFGNPQTALRFNVSAEMREKFEASVRLLAHLTGQHGFGRIQLPEREFGTANHHMHTTRMSDDPARGVVDANGKVHGVSNIFVAGSSVFPSSGCGNPTFPLIALTARLAHHLAESFGRGAFSAT